MLSLILETSTEKACLILAENDLPLVIKHLPSGPELSRSLAKEVDSLLAKRKPDCIAVGHGPGSYTGIRVSAALGKALAYAWNIPLIGFCSLEAFGSGNIVFDARSGGFFVLIDNQAQITKTLPFKNFVTPHFERLKEKFDCEEAEPNAGHIASMVFDAYKRGEFPPFSLNYLASP